MTSAARIESLLDVVPVAIAVPTTLAAIAFANWILLRRHPSVGGERRLTRQLAVLCVAAAGLLAVILSLPVDDSTKSQLMGVAGLLISGAIAFSSTSLIGNAMAGVMLRITRSFRTGDFIRVAGHFGRVAQRGLLDTEIQNEDRELVSVPNTFLVTNPVSVARSSGVIVSSTLSLGYDLHHSRVEPLLLEAARRSDLDDPFVQILELGDFSVRYRVAGLLVEVKNVLSARSNLCRNVLDALHGNGIEIVSPAFMNQRRIPEGAVVIPPQEAPVGAPAPDVPEEMIFDKAARAEKTELARKSIQARIRELEQKKKAGVGEASQLDEELCSLRASLREIEIAPEADD